jgi:hypothetical protein
MVLALITVSSVVSADETPLQKKAENHAKGIGWVGFDEAPGAKKYGRRSFFV